MALEIGSSEFFAAAKKSYPTWIAESRDETLNPGNQVRIAFHLPHSFASLHSVVGFQSRLAFFYKLDTLVVDLQPGCVDATLEFLNSADKSKFEELLDDKSLDGLLYTFRVFHIKFAGMNGPRSLFYKRKSLYRKLKT